MPAAPADAAARLSERLAEPDVMLAVDSVLGRTRLSWLGTGPVVATPAAVMGGELGRLAFLRALDAHTPGTADSSHMRLPSNEANR